MERSRDGGPGYTSPSRKSPGLIIFVVDRSLPNPKRTNKLQSALEVVYTQVEAIKNRFQSNNKQKTFRFVVIEFANAPQRLNRTYLVDDFVENIDVIQYRKSQNGKVRGTSLKKVLHEVDNCVEDHMKTRVTDLKNAKPPISIILFSGNPHEQMSDYSFNPQFVGVSTPTEFAEKSVQEYVDPILQRDNVFFGVIDFIESRERGEKIEDASIITKNLIDSAIVAENRYGVLHGNRIRDVWPNPMELVGKKFILAASNFNAQKLSKFLAAMLKLGTYTSTSSSDEDDDGSEEFY
jgi:hypothetical protein